MKLIFPCLAMLLLSACVSSPQPAVPDPAVPAVGDQEAQAAVDRATKDTKTAHAFGLDKTSWDLVRIAHEDIAAANTSIDNGEYAAAKRLADGASSSLRKEIRRAFDTLHAKVNAAVDVARQAENADEEMVTAAEFHLAEAVAAADSGKFLMAKEIVDDVADTLAKAAAAKR